MRPALFNREDGMHWRYSTNGELRSAIIQRIHEDYPEIWHPEEEHDGVLTAIFGSWVATVKLRSDGYDARNIFMHGHCIALALALHEHLGYPFVVFTNSKPGEAWSGHVGLLLSPGKLIDFDGVKSFEAVERDYFNAKLPLPEVLTREELVQRHTQYPEDPLSYLDTMERLIVEDFATYVMETHELKRPS